MYTDIMTRTKKMGRPPMPDEERKSHMIRIRVTEDEWKLLEKRAAQCGLSVSQLLMKPYRKG